MPAPTPGVSPHLSIDGCAAAIDFYKKAFGAEEIRRVPMDDGKRLLHAEITIAGTLFYLNDCFPEHHGGKKNDPNSLGNTPVIFHQYVPSADAAVKRATDAGAKVIMPVADQFWGDRYGIVQDPFGYQWSFGTPLKK